MPYRADVTTQVGRPSNGLVCAGLYESRDARQVCSISVVVQRGTSSSVARVPGVSRFTSVAANYLMAISDTTSPHQLENDDFLCTWHVQAFREIRV